MLVLAMFVTVVVGLLLFHLWSRRRRIDTDALVARPTPGKVPPVRSGVTEKAVASASRPVNERTLNELFALNAHGRHAFAPGHAGFGRRRGGSHHPNGPGDRRAPGSRGQQPAVSYALAELDAIMPLVAGPLGRHILASWEFPGDLVELPERAEQWFYDSGRSVPDLAELLVLANWHSHVGTPRMADLPSLATLPVFGKLSGAELSPEASLSLLNEAKEQINAACAFFRH